jgi:hypothetical protein
VVLDGASVKSGTLLAAQADGGEVTSACATSARARYDRPHVDHHCKPFFGFTRQPLIGVVRASAADALTQPSANEGSVGGWLSEPPSNLELLHNLRDLTDPDGRRRGPQVAHGSHAATDVMGIMLGYINPQ